MDAGSGNKNPEILHLICDPANPSLPAAVPAFERVLAEINAARETIEIHIYVWRSDAIGNRIGSALLDAAGRGVKIRILKDGGAIMYERIEMNRKSFFHTDLPPAKRLIFRLLGRSFPDTYVEDDYGSELGRELAAHPNVDLVWVNKTHTKYYVFDEKRILTGSINIEDRHTGYLDYMVALEGEDVVSHFRSRLQNIVPCDPAREIDFLCNTHHPDGTKSFEIKPALLDALARAKKSIYIEMAYLGDDNMTRAITDAARRGVETTVLFSEEANIGNDINYRTIYRIASQSPVHVYLTRKMIHSKLMVIDGEWVTLGSCNLSVFSLQKAGELNLAIRGQLEFMRTLNSVTRSRVAASRKVESPGELKKYRPWVAALQQLHQKWNPN